MDKLAKEKTLDPKIDYKNLDLVNSCTADSGKIIAGRNTGKTHKEQRQVAKAIKIARFLALIPYTDKR